MSKLPALDIVDLKILDELQANCRITNRALAARVGLSASPCLRRVRALEQRRTIVDTTAIISPEALGFGFAAFAQVTLEKGDSFTDERFLSALAAIPAVSGWYACAGDYDYLVKIVVPGQDTYLKTMVSVRRLIGVAGVKSGIVIDPQPGLFAFYRSTYPQFQSSNSAETKAMSVHYAGGSLDQFDRKIVTGLQKNARISILALSRLVALSAPATLQRLRKLEASKVIQGYTAIVDPFALGLQLVALIAITLEKSTSGKSFQKALLTRSEVAACFSVAGDVDFEVRAVFSNIESYTIFLRNFLRRLKGVAQVHSSICISPPPHLFSRYSRIVSPLSA